MRPSVLLLCTRPVGGAALYATNLQRDLPDHGFDTHLAWGRDTIGEGSVTPSSGLEAIEVPHLRRELRPPDDLRASRAIARLVRELRPSVVHTNQAKAGMLGRRVAARADVGAVVHTYHGHVLERYFPALTSRAFLAAERRAARYAGALVSVSVRVRDELMSMGIGRPDQWHVIPVGLDLERFLEPRAPASARDALDLGDGPVVSMVGRLAPVKDHATFLRAAGRIREARPDATFVVAGEGPERDRLQAGPGVRFLGHVTDLPALLAATDVVVLTSRQEGTPTALIEAAAAGIPVVATRVGGSEEVVTDGETGYLVGVGDDAAVAARVLELLARPEAAVVMGKAGRSLVCERYGAKRLAGEISDLYRDLLSKR